MTIIPETPASYDEARVIELPDGFYWEHRLTGERFGPFPTLLEAVEDMQYNDEADFEPGESLEEAEAELGISDWIDPDTGLPAEETTHHFND